MTKSKDIPGAKPDLATALRWTALFGSLIGGLLPASAGVELFPQWDLDPSVQWVPSTGIPPLQMLLLALLSVASAGLAILADTIDGTRASPLPALLAGIGTLGVLAHGLFDSALHGSVQGGYEGAKDGIEHLVRAAPWVAMIWSWVGVSRLCRDVRTKPIVLAAIAGFMAMLLAKGLLQVFTEHPLTVADFESNKDAILASNGWSPGSPGALAYERRLVQPEASGWFGLSNVYATVVGAGLAGLVASGVSLALRTRRISTGLLVCAAAAACALIGLVLSKSKGGIGAAGIGLGVCAVFGIASRLSRLRPETTRKLARWAGPAVIAGVLGLIALRGLIGPDFAERSLLFRAFYAVGSLRIWADHPFFGVGPDGFQDAYAAAKIPIATETVQSPHSVLFDWTATLGVFGLAWAALLVWQSTRLFGAHDADGHTAPLEQKKSTGFDRGAVRFLVLVIAAVGLAATGFERALATPSFALARVVGLGAWVAASIGLLSAFRDRAATRWFGFASGLAIVAHMQIEVTPVWVNAGPLLGVWLGAVTGWPPATDRTGEKPRGSRIGPGVPLVAVGIGIATVGIAMPATLRWQAALGRAAETVRPAAEARMQYEAYATARDYAGIRDLVNSIQGVGSSGIRRNPQEAIEHVRLAWLEVAVDDLAAAVAARPGNGGTRKALGRMLLEQATEGRTNEHVERFARLAVISALEVEQVRPRSVGLWDWSGVVHERAGDILSARVLGESGQVERGRARDIWEYVDGLSPYSVRPAVRLMDLTSAVRWAREALRRDDLAALDPIAGLSDAERARAEALVAGADRAED